MKKALITAACAVLLTSTMALAQSSEGKGGAPKTGESAAPGVTSNGTAGSGSTSATPAKAKVKKHKKKK